MLVFTPPVDAGGPGPGLTLFRSFIMTNEANANAIADEPEEVGLYATNNVWLEKNTVGGALVGWQTQTSNFGSSQVDLGMSADPDKINGNIWIQDNRSPFRLRVGYIPPGDYRMDFCMGPGPENTASGVCDFSLYDGSNRGGAATTLVYEQSRAEITTGGQYWDFLADGTLFNALDWLARDVSVRSVPITISPQASTDLEGFSLLFNSGVGSGGGTGSNYLRVNWIRMWTVN